MWRCAMSRRELDELRAEVAHLEEILAGMALGRIIERRGFEARLEEVRARAAELEKLPLAKPVVLTFRGGPVDGSRSIVADFAGRALAAFSESVEMVVASLGTDLRGSGPVPGAGKRPLRVVSTATGSFGFELELPARSLEDEAAGQLEMPLEGPDPHAMAITSVLDLVEEAGGTDEDGLSDRIADIHPRAAAKVRAFVQIVDQADAVFAAEFEGKRLRIDDRRGMRRVLEALKSEDIEEREIEQRGTLIGVLPDARQFEVHLEDGGLILRGKLARTIEDALGFRRGVQDRPAILRLREVRVRDRKRYILLSAEPLPEDDGGSGGVAP